MARMSIHPLVDNGIAVHADAHFTGGTLTCKCAADAVEVRVDSPYQFNHLCGCTQCWKPGDAVFSMLAAVPREAVHVTRHKEKLHVVDTTKLLHRYACRDCGTHMYGVIDRPDHVFHGFTFIHPELSKETGYAPPTFAAFVSSVIEGGVSPQDMTWLRQRLRELGLAPYDCYSPELMDIVAAHAARASGVLNDQHQ